jgi:hypothetical protein
MSTTPAVVVGRQGASYPDLRPRALGASLQDAVGPIGPHPNRQHVLFPALVCLTHRGYDQDEWRPSAGLRFVPDWSPKPVVGGRVPPALLDTPCWGLPANTQINGPFHLLTKRTRAATLIAAKIPISTGMRRVWA